MFVQYKADQTEYFFFLQLTVPKILWHGIYSTFHDRKKQNFQAINSKNEIDNLSTAKPSCWLFDQKNN